MSRKNKTLRSFLHQTPSPTIEQAWDCAWKHAQKTFHARSMQDMEEQLEIERDYSKALEKRIAELEKLPHPHNGEQGGEWVAGDDKRPTEEDADHWGRVFVWFPEVPDEEPEVAHVSEFNGADKFTLARIMWKPTGLTRPQPPKSKEGEGDEH